MGGRAKRRTFAHAMLGIALAFGAVTRADSSSYVAVLNATLPSVAEFQLLKAEAEKLGLRLWLFGGTAAAFAHYVRDKQQFQGGDRSYQQQHFDDDFTNIFRSTQDLDVVVDDLEPTDDATHLERLKRLEALVTERPGLRYFLGGKSAWEIRSLRRTNGSKVALLDNPHYLNQHLDSHSTGLIELTEPVDGRRIRDVKAWDEEEPPFLRDVLAAKLHYYWGANHHETSRAKEGLNPPIFSVVRFLTKAFQYQLSVDEPTWAKLLAVIEAFDAKRDLRTEYAREWLERNGKKLYLHASNMIYARQRLDDAGLRTLLEGLRNDGDTIDTLAWWMHKSPLPELPILEPDGAETAGSLGIDVVAHETRSFAAYESICRSRRGIPNVFQSRQKNATHPKGFAGESASLGDGFYTMWGRTGGRGTGITVRFRVDPRARAGRDFTREGTQIVFHNRGVLTVIPESLDVSPLEFLDLIESRTFFAAKDRGVLEKLRRRSAHRLELSADATLRDHFYDRGLALVGRLPKERAQLALDEWFLMASPEARRKLSQSEAGQAQRLALLASPVSGPFLFEDEPELTEKTLAAILAAPVNARPWDAIVTLLRNGEKPKLRRALLAGPIAAQVGFLAQIHVMHSQPSVVALIDDLKKRFRALPNEAQEALVPTLREAVGNNRHNSALGGAIRLWTALHTDWPTATGRLARSGWLDDLQKDHAIARCLRFTDFGIGELATDAEPLFDTLHRNGASSAVAYEIASHAVKDGDALAKHAFRPRVAAATTVEEVHAAVYAASSTRELQGRLGESVATKLVALKAPAAAVRAIVEIPWQSHGDAIRVASRCAMDALRDSNWLDLFDPVPEKASSNHYRLESAFLQTLISGSGALLRSVDRERLERVAREYKSSAITEALRRLRAEPLEPPTAAGYLRRWAPWPEEVYFSEEDLELAVRRELDAFFATKPTFAEGERLLESVSGKRIDEKHTTGAVVRRGLYPLARRPNDIVRIFQARERPLTREDFAVLDAAYPHFFAIGATPDDVKALETAINFPWTRNTDALEEMYRRAWDAFAADPNRRALLAAPGPTPTQEGQRKSVGPAFVAARLEELLRQGPHYASAAYLRHVLAREIPEAALRFDTLFTALFPQPEHALAVLEDLAARRAFGPAQAFGQAQWSTFLRGNPPDGWIRRYLAASGRNAAVLATALPDEQRCRVRSPSRRAVDWLCSWWLARR